MCSRDSDQALTTAIAVLTWVQQLDQPNGCNVESRLITNLILDAHQLAIRSRRPTPKPVKPAVAGKTQPPHRRFDRR